MAFPIHILLMASREGLKEKICSQKNEILSEIRNKLDKYNVGGESYQTTSISDQENQLHAHITKKLNDITLLPPATVGAQFQLDGFIQIQPDTDEQDHDFKDRPPGSQPKGLLI